MSQIMEKLNEIDKKISENFESLIETIEILLDKKLLREIAESIKEIEDGKYVVVRSIDELKKVIDYDDSNI